MKCYLSLTEHMNCVTCLVLLSNGILAYGSDDKTIKLWDILETKSKFTLVGHTNCIKCIV